MRRRVAAGVLWFLCGWYVGAAVAWMLALSPILAPILAIAAGSLVVTDPRRVIWHRRTPAPFARSEALPEAA
jgi:hypothetical protein